MFYEDDDVGAIEKLGELKPVKAGDSEERFAEFVNVVGASVRSLSGQMDKIRERVDRAVATEGRDLLHAMNAERGLEWVPGGSARDLDRRYLRADGAVQLGTGTQAVALPDGSTASTRAVGLLTDPYPVTREQAEVQTAYQAYALAYGRARRTGAPFRDTLVQRSYIDLHARLSALPGRVGAYCRALLESPEAMKRAVSNTAGAGAELIGTPYNAGIIRPFDLDRSIVGLFNKKEASAPAMKRQVVSGRGLMRKRGLTSSDDPARYGVQSFTTADETITLIDFVVMTLVDKLWAADVNIGGNPMDEVIGFLRRAIVDSLEMAILHGDTAATHQDTVAAWTMGSLFTAGLLSGSDSPLTQWIGLRALAFDNSATVAGGGTFGIDDQSSAMTKMGNHGVQRDVVAIWGLAGYLTQVYANAAFTTWDKMGPLATQITGIGSGVSPGAIGGIPLYLSEFLAAEYETTGLFTDGSGAKNTAVYCRTSAFDLWTLLQGAGDFEDDQASKGGLYVGSILRALFVRNCKSTEKPSSVIINL